MSNEFIEKEYDINQLFHLNYSFDPLKAILTNLLLQQKNTNQRLNELNDTIKDKDKIISK